jgi:aldehyde:ferredoxin oxidoreductase
MDSKEIKDQQIGNEWDMSGGRGLIAKILNDEVDPTCDPLGSENKLIFCVGVLAGTNAPTAGRLSVGAKSPLTGGVKEANAGGTFGSKMADHGVKAIIIEGTPEDDSWYILRINDSGAEFLPADKYSEMNNYELSEHLMKEFGDEISIASIGCAGERGYKNSSVQITDMDGMPSRAAARGGLGSVMGSKYIKAIIIEPAKNKSRVEYADYEAFKIANKEFIKGIKANETSGVAMPALGTAVLVNPVNTLGAMPTNNFRSGSFDKAEKISGEYLAEMQSNRGGKNGHRCQPGCPIGCSNVYLDKNSDYLTSGFEYETIALNGSNLGIADLDVIAQIDRLCDDLGIDTMETGCTLGVCMEAGKLEFGDAEGAVSLIREMSKGTEFGNILGQGTGECGKYLNVKRIPVVKNQGLAAYDPRSLKGTGVSYATSPMGADHTAGNTLGNPTVVPFEKEGQVELSTNTQVGMATFDSLGMCIFAGFCTADPANINHLVSLLKNRFGGSWTPEQLFGLGVETIALEKKFNLRAGFTEEDNRLPEFMYHEILPPRNTVFDISPEELAMAIPF